MEHYELRVLLDYLHTGTQVANTPARPSPKDVGGELERDEVAEAVFGGIWSPVTGAGVAEALKKIIPVIDGDKYGEYVSLSGIRDSVMLPPKERIWSGKLFSFGKPMSSDPLLSTTLKYTNSLTLETLAGGTDITQDYLIRIFGYVYKTSELPIPFTNRDNPEGLMLFPTEIRNAARNRVIPVVKDAIPIDGANWKKLPGGKDQSIPKINPFIRYAYNKKATDGKSGDYEFRYDIGNVEESEEELFFDFGKTDALIVDGLGIRAPAHLQNTAMKIGGDYHPKGLFPTTQYNNLLHFGWAYPMFPSDIPLYYAIPSLRGLGSKPLLIFNEKGGLVTQDDGTIIAANDIIACLTGVRVEMTG